MFRVTAIVSAPVRDKVIVRIRVTDTVGLNLGFRVELGLRLWLDLELYLGCG